MAKIEFRSGLDALTILRDRRAIGTVAWKDGIRLRLHGQEPVVFRGVEGSKEFFVYMITNGAPVESEFQKGVLAGYLARQKTENRKTKR